MPAPLGPGEHARTAQQDATAGHRREERLPRGRGEEAGMTQVHRASERCFPTIQRHGRYLLAFVNDPSQTVSFAKYDKRKRLEK